MHQIRALIIFSVLAVIVPAIAHSEPLYECKDSVKGTSSFTHDPRPSAEVTCEVFKSDSGGFSHVRRTTFAGNSSSSSGSSKGGGRPKGGLFGMGGAVEKKLWGKSN